MGKVGKAIKHAVHDVGHIAKQTTNAISSTVTSVAKGVTNATMKGIGAATSMFEHLAPGLKNLDKILKLGLSAAAMPLNPFSFMKGMKNLPRGLQDVFKHLQNPLLNVSREIHKLIGNFGATGIAPLPPQLQRMQNTLTNFGQNFDQINQSIVRNLRA